MVEGQEGDGGRSEQEKAPGARAEQEKAQATKQAVNSHEPQSDAEKYRAGKDSFRAAGFSTQGTPYATRTDPQNKAGQVIPVHG